ncbi:hypothetical protein LguiB_024518 [Lonicera macranthoides]
MSSSSSRCAACKYLRRRRASDCIFSPYFAPNNPQRFASVHLIYGANNVGKMLQQIQVHERGKAADSLYYEAQCRIQDPVYGCVGIISQLHQQIYNAQSQLAKTQEKIPVFNAQVQANQPNDQYYQQHYTDESAGFNNFLLDQNGASTSTSTTESSFYGPSSTW